MNTILQTLGLGSRERQVLTFLLKAGRPLKSREIAVALGMSRQTVYSILVSCAERTLVIQTDRNGVKYFYTDTKELVKYVELEEDKLSKIKHALHGDKAYLVKKESTKALPQVHFYEGALGLRKLFENILDQYKKGKHKKFRGYGINYFSHSKALEDYLDYFVKKRGAYGVVTNLFIAQGPDDFHITNSGNSYGRVVKRIDIDPQMAGVYLVADRVYLFSYQDNVGIMVRNQAIVALLKEVFDDHWRRV